MSSLPKLQAYLNQVSSNYSKNQSLPVTRSLLKTLRLLSTPTDHAFRPIDIVAALANNHRVVNRQQQDAQELYQLLISELENESQKQKSKQQGLCNLLPLRQGNSNLGENPLNGLLAYRIACTKCNYSVNYYKYFIIDLFTDPFFSLSLVSLYNHSIMYN